MKKLRLIVSLLSICFLGLFCVYTDTVVAQDYRLFMGGVELANHLPSNSCSFSTISITTSNRTVPAYKCDIGQGVAVNLATFQFPNETGLTLKGRGTLSVVVDGSGTLTSDHRLCFELLDHIAQRNSADTALTIQSAYPGDNVQNRSLSTVGGPSSPLAINKHFISLPYGSDTQWMQNQFTVKADSPPVNCGDTCDYSPVYIRVRRIACNSICTASGNPFNCCTGSGAGTCDPPSTVKAALIGFGYKFMVE